MLRVAARLTLDGVVVAVALLASAGTLQWSRAWVLVTVLMLVRMVGAFVVHRVSPELLRERAGMPIHAGQAKIDRALLLGVLATGFVGVPVIAGFDAFHWHLLSPPLPAVAWLGLILFALGWTLKSLALHANAFAVAVVRLQRERAHAVADSGVYGIVRHPFYAADPLIFVGAGLWLNSYAAALSAVIPVVLMLVRLRREDAFLHRELAGYASYAARVRYRLLPGLW